MVRAVFVDYEREEGLVLKADYLTKSFIRKAMKILALNEQYERVGFETYVIRHIKLGNAKCCYSDKVRKVGYAIKVGGLGNDEIHLHLKGPGNRQHYAYEYQVINAIPQIIR